ncbi:MAG: hypothetical protein NT070_14995 [Cyanobacteria bacterium]|nr:hypothetical protein [Cyanobacteriota bacterium]
MNHRSSTNSDRAWSRRVAPGKIIDRSSGFVLCHLGASTCDESIAESYGSWDLVDAAVSGVS